MFSFLEAQIGSKKTALGLYQESLADLCGVLMVNAFSLS
jgi:hypothetical protein